jgi:hypothetical protein
VKLNRICGWKQKEHPMLYNVLHIGDKVLNIAGISVKSAADAYRILESHYCGLYVGKIGRKSDFLELVIYRWILSLRGYLTDRCFDPPRNRGPVVGHSSREQHRSYRIRRRRQSGSETGSVRQNKNLRRPLPDQLGLDRNQRQTAEPIF